MANLRGMSIAALVAAMQGTNTARVFGFENIKRTLQRSKGDKSRKGRNSIAECKLNGDAHEHKREIARRLRQQAYIQARANG